MQSFTLEFSDEVWSLIAQECINTDMRPSDVIKLAVVESLSGRKQHAPEPEGRTVGEAETLSWDEQELIVHGISGMGE